MRIAHIADVHYRSLSRHSEYRTVFEKFANECEELGVDHIVVAGDIFHTKTTGISPEYVTEISWWMKRLSDAAPLHLTLGNHDGNLVNLNRQDAVTPVYEALRNDKNLKNPIYLYKQSGVYPIDDRHNLCVFSLFDEEGWDKVSPVSGRYNIAVYHGPVNCAVTEVGWTLTSDVTIDKFKDFDITLLGDIHKTQFLGYRDQNGKEVPWIGYPGSTLQQNYAESIEHGYLLWDIGTNGHSVTFNKLPNPKPYVTIKWTSDFSSINVPHNSRVRIKHDRPLAQSEIQGIIKHLKSNFQVIETTFSTNQQAIENVNQHKKSLVVEENFHNTNTLSAMLRDMETTHDFTDVEWEKINGAVGSYLSQISGKNEVPRNVKWSLKELKFDNVLGYGDGNSINFQKMNGIIGIFGPNRVGKSSSIGALAYCLFNGSDRGSIKNLELINVRKQHAYARAVIDVGGIDYVIERQSVKNQTNKGVNASTAVNLFKLLDGEAITLNGEQRSDTDKLIRELIGSSDDFMLTSLAAQGDLDRFIKEGSTYRKKVLNRFLDIDFFDDLHELSKQDVSSLKSEIKSLQSIKVHSSDDIDPKLKEIDDSISSLVSDSESTSRLLEKTKSNLDSLNSSARIFSLRNEKIGALNECIDRIAYTESQVVSLQEKFAALKGKLTSTKESLTNLDVESAKALSKELRVASDERLKLEYLAKELNKEGDRKKRSVNVLSEVPCGDSFPSCKFIKDAHVDKSTLDDTITKAKLVEDRLESIVKKISEIAASNSDAVISKESELKNTISTLEIEVNKVEADIQLKNDRISYLEKQKKSLTEEIASLPQAVDNVENEFLMLSNNLKELKAELAEQNKRLSDLYGTRGVFLEQKRQSVEVQAKMDVLLQELKLKEFIMTSFSKKGIPSKVLSSQLPQLNDQISQILAGVVDFTVEADCSDASSLEIYINYGDSRRPIELCSGMEKMISSIAIRAAMTSISMIPRSDALIIDEGFGTLDDAGVEACKKLLLSMKDFFKSIIIISHVPGIKDVADTIIEIEKVEKDSRVFYA